MLETLTSEQSTFLKKVRDQKVFEFELSSEEKSIYKYLKKQGFVKGPNAICKDLYENEIPLKIEEAGKQYLECEAYNLEERKQKEKDAAFTRKLSVLSLIISVCTLLSNIYLHFH